MNIIPLRLKYYSGIDIFNVLNDSELEYEKIMELIKKFGDLPGADVLKVIRCKDCRHFEIINQPYDQKWCHCHFRGVSDQEFCSRAERRTDG